MIEHSIIISKKREKYKRIGRIIAGLLIILIEMVLYKIIWDHYLSPDVGVWYAARGNWMLVAVYAMMLIAFNQMYGGFKMGYLDCWNIIYSQILSTVLVNVITFCQISLMAFQFPQIIHFICLELMEVVVIFIWAITYYKIYSKVFPIRKLLLIYKEEESLTLVNKLEGKRGRYKVEKIIPVNELKEYSICQNYEGVVLCDIPTDKRNKILKYCFEEGIRCYITPKISDILIRSAEEMGIIDTPLLLLRNQGLTIEQKIIKRIMDIVGALVLIILASPFMLITALSIKLYDHGPIIYTQERLTENGKVFKVKKFRSMKCDAEADGIARLAKEHDDRITPIGKVIRAIRVDELPQLINILSGDMSLVGPRPERPELAEELSKTIPQFKDRLKVKAGLTGYAQVYGKYNTTAYDKLRLDITYIQNYSILLDIKLIIMTVKILFMKESTEGIEDHLGANIDG